MDAPVVGLTTYRQQAAWGVWNTRADLLPTEYAVAVEAAGGVPLLLPPVALPGAAERVVARIDALVVSGGADVDPERYGATPHARTAGWQPERDAWELALLTAADEVGLPVLGICRGMQLMAVHAGGTLDQHTPDLVGHDDHSPGGDVYGDVEVETEPGSLLAAPGRRAGRGQLPPPPVRGQPSRLHRGRPGRRRDRRGDGGDRRPLAPRRAVAPGDAGRDRPDGRPGRRGAPPRGVAAP